MKASRVFWGVPELPTTYAKGRVCEHPRCTTVLSIYNERPYCEAHKEDWFHDWEPEYDENWNRVCPQCGAHKSPTTKYFMVDERSKDGLSRLCTPCRKQVGKQRRAVMSREEQLQKKRDQYYQKKFGYPSQMEYLRALWNGDLKDG